MDPLTRLPVECLHHILHFIVSSTSEDPKSASTLFSLCTVNRHIALVTFRCLYQDPFRLLYTIPDSKERPRPLRERSLLRTLLTNSTTTLPLTNIHRAVASELNIDTFPSPSSEKQHNNYFFQIDYLSLVHNLTPPRTNYRKFYTWRVPQDNLHEEPVYSKETMRYIYSSEYTSICPPFLNNAACGMHKDPLETSFYLYPIVVYRELIWTLQNPIFEQAQSITIPMSDIRRYQDVIHRLKNLERIHIVMDLKHGCYSCGYGQASAFQKSNTSEANAALVRFLDDHAQFFFPEDGQRRHRHRRRRVKDATISLPCYHLRLYDAPRRDTVDWDILRALPPIHRPRFITPDTSPRIHAHLPRTDLSLVRSNDWWNGDLKTFRGLESLTLVGSEIVNFEWAVEEKRDLENIRHGGAIGGLRTPLSSGSPISSSRKSSNGPDNKMIDDSDDEPLHPYHLTHGLIPLSKVHIKQCSMPSTNLDVLLDAFSNSLESITISSIRAPKSTLPVHIGHNWVDLPCLSHLEIHFPMNIETHNHFTRNHRLVLDRLLFARCPSLQTVKIRDDTYLYSHDDIVSCHAADLPRLQMLHLTGWSALTFHPATLETTKKLQVLRLTMDPSRDGFIPPVEELARAYGGYELNEDFVDRTGAQPVAAASFAPPPLTTIRRPHWTWRWHLPCLTHLLLASEFAYRFKFRMLLGCPALEKLHLHMKTLANYKWVNRAPHSRVITKSDLYFVPDAADDASSTQKNEERIVVPTLRSLVMEGRWSFEDHGIMHQFLVDMFPNLERLSMRGGGGEGRVYVRGMTYEKVLAWHDELITVALWAKLLRTTLSHVRLLATDLEGPLLVSREDMVQWRMISLPYVAPKGTQQKHNTGGRGVFKKLPGMLSNRLICAGREYVLLREKPSRKRGGKKKQETA